MKTYKSLIISIGLVTLINVLLIAGPGTPNTDKQCTSGGPGASTCEISFGIAGGSVSCSVTCNAGTYACCYLANNLDPVCKCKSTTANPN